MLCRCQTRHMSNIETRLIRGVFVLHRLLFYSLIIIMVLYIYMICVEAVLRFSWFCDDLGVWKRISALSNEWKNCN